MIFPRRTCWRRTRKTDWGDSAIIEEAQPQAEGSDFRQRHRREEAFWQNQMRERSWPRLTAGDGGEEAGMENPGEAVLTSGLTVSDYIAGVQLKPGTDPGKK